MSKKNERKEKVKYAIENGETVEIICVDGQARSGKLVEQDSDTVTVYIEEGWTVYIAQAHIISIAVKEVAGEATQDVE